MKFSYKFSNLLGTVYRNGNLLFTPDGNSVISPVGNRLSVHDLKNNKARTMALESRYNYTNIALSPDGCILIAVNENGEAQMIVMVTCTVVHSHKFKGKVQCVAFSPNGRNFAVAQENVVFVFVTPGELTGEYNPFVLQRHFIGGYDDVTWLDWSTDSRFLAVGCRDNTTKICALRFMSNFRTYILSGHTDTIVGCFFEANSLHVNTLSRNGQLCLWECSLLPSDLEEVVRGAKNARAGEQSAKKKKAEAANESSDEEYDGADDIEKAEPDMDAVPVDENEVKDEVVKKSHPFFYKKLGRFYLADEPRKENRNAVLTAANYCSRIKVLVVGFSTGAFYLYELPEVNMIHSLSISNYPLSAAVFNPSGDWVALASRELGQLLVWEWQSEQYVLKQQGHASEMTCISYAPDGQYIATGGQDAKLKLWNTLSGFCFVTFSEHTGGITGVQFSRNKKFLVSSSLDGTVRAFDIIRYRNFRTFTSPRRVQFSCVTIDYSGEFVAAGGQDVFDIYLWSIKVGKLLEVISSHEGPVCSLAFSPIPTSTTLVSGSWDKTIKVWNCLERSGTHETIDLYADVTCVAFKPNGEHIAVATLNGNITVFDIKTSAQVGSIEGRNDLSGGRSEIDLITAEKNLLGKCFTSIEYSADGDCILAGGKSHEVCIYHVSEAILLKKFEITQNQSFDGLNDFINRRNMTEFGNMALVEKREEREGGNVAIRLPGVQKGDMASRKFKPEVRIFSVKFAPTGQAFAVACTEGLCIYSLDSGVVFDPLYLSIDVTPKAAREALEEKEFSKALIMALKLNEFNLIHMVLEKIPYEEIQLICRALSNEFAQRLVPHITQLLSTSPHIEFYLEWSCCILTSHANKDGAFQHHTLLGLQESLQRKYELLHKVCDYNTYTMTALLKANEKRQELAKSKKKSTNDDDSDDDSEDLDDMLLIKSTDVDMEEKEAEFADENDEDDDDDDDDVGEDNDDKDGDEDTDAHTNEAPKSKV